MARPVKKGLDYFPLYVDIFDNEKVAAISGEFQLKGEIIVIKLLCAVYRNGYYYEWSEMNRMYLLRQLPGVSSGLLEQVVQRLVKWGFFDRSLFDSPGVLTSRRIQEHYFAATLRRKSAIDRTQYPYLLIPTPEKDVSACKNPVQTELMFTETPQRKEKERKTPHSLPAGSGEHIPGFSPGGGATAPPSGRKEGERVADTLGDMSILPRDPTFADGRRRNYAGLLQAMAAKRIPAGQQSQIVMLSDYGLIGHPVWELLRQIDDSGGKIKQPGTFILARLKRIQNEPQAPSTPPEGELL